MRAMAERNAANHPADRREAYRPWRLASSTLLPVSAVILPCAVGTAESSTAFPTRSFELCNGVAIELVLIAAGEFLMGAPEGESPLDCDEQPVTKVSIEKPFWLGKFEVTNQQFACFDPHHDTGWIDTHGKDRVGPGVPMNGPQQPVARVSWHEAMGFCQWLGQRLGVTCRLPTEAEWEYACRAGTQTPYSCGDATLLAEFANVADATLQSLKPWAVRDEVLNDGAATSCDVGRYKPNPWGLHDMHGNVWEWTSSEYRPYPYDAHDGRNDLLASGPRVARGGSWDDIPQRCRSAYRLSYDPTQRVYNVGFRVVIDQ